MLFNPEWSLKIIELHIQVNVSDAKPSCSPFLRTSYEGWTAWLRKRGNIYRNRIMRDVTGMLGTGLGVLNSID